MPSRHLCLIRTSRFWPLARHWLSVALSLLIVATGSAAAEPPSQPLRTDLYGDTLPAGALARLGTVRFRHYGAFLVAYAPDGKTIRSVGCATFRRWHAATGKELQQWPTCPSELACAAFAADGSLLAVAGQHKICTYDTTTGKELRCLELGKESWTHSLAFSADNKFLASKQAFDATVTLWELQTGKKRCELRPPENEDADPGQGAGLLGQHLTFSPDGKQVACVSEDSVVRVWQVATGREIRQYPAASRTSVSVAISPDARILAWAGQQCVCLADRATGKELTRLPTGPGSPRHLAFSPDSKLLASVSGFDEVHLWDPARGKPLRALQGELSGIESVTFSPDGKLLAACVEGRIRQWDVATGRELPDPRTSQGPVFQVALSPDGTTAASADDTGNIRLWDTGTGRERLRLDETRCGGLVFSPDGKRLAWGGDGDLVRIADTATGKETRRLSAPAFGYCDLAFSADGAAVAMAQQAGTYCLWDVPTGRELRRFQARLPGKASVAHALAKDGSLLALYEGRVVQLSDTATGAECPVPRVTTGEIETVALSSDCRALAVWTRRRDKRNEPEEGSGVLLLYEVATGRERWRLPIDDVASRTAFEALAFCPDGRTLAVLDNEHVIRLLDVIGTKEIGRFRTGQTMIASLTYSADGRTLASGARDTTVLLWDLATLRRPGRAGPPPVPTSRELEALWSDLAGEDAARAYRAVCALTTPAAVPFLAGRLQEEAQAGVGRGQRILRLLRDLDDDAFTVRRSAAAELERLADLAEPLLRRALADHPSPELRRQANQLLEKREGTAPAPQTLHVLRAVEALERLGTPEARRVLQALAEGVPEARLTREARKALERLARRGVSAP